jgi:nanoRNase/pAp phosphatase (c-di-AMP/oligoRNAs hydrolase)
MYKLPREDRDPEFYEGVFGQPPPDVKGRDVVLVDFSYPRDQMFTLAKDAKSLLVLDHHKTAQETLQLWVAPQNTTVIFDMNKSGAGLAWDYYFPKAERPFLVNYVEDRDLWNWKLPHSRELNAYISILPFVFEAWTAAHIGGMIPEGITESIKMGRAALAKTAQYVAEVKKNAYLTVFEGHTVPIVNAPQVDISELVHSLCEDGGYHPFAMGFGQRSDGMFAYSLRSIGDFDVSELAKRYGGGGHKNSAGFTSHGLVHNWTM